MWDRVKVVVRFRPLSVSEEKNSQHYWHVSTKEKKILLNNNVSSDSLNSSTNSFKKFSFDNVFDGTTSTMEMYESCIKKVVNGAVKEGLNGAVLAYGQSNSGKTFTMQGNNFQKGIVQLAAENIFSHIDESPKRIFLVQASFIEIYNEQLRDLLDEDGSSEKIGIHYSKNAGTTIKTKTVVVRNVNELLEILAGGKKNRVVASTNINSQSSRSHAIFRITIDSRQVSINENCLSQNEVISAELNLVDLAGSERSTDADTSGLNLKEGSQINQSLLALSQVIKSLGRHKVGFINYRDSKLTEVLRTSLNGNARIVIICCATPSDKYVQETISTLRFASHAKLVRTNATQNKRLDSKLLIRKLKSELTITKRELNRIKENEFHNSAMDIEMKKKDELLSQLRDLLTKEKQRVYELEKELEHLTEISVSSRNPSCKCTIQ